MFTKNTRARNKSPIQRRYLISRFNHFISKIWAAKIQFVLLTDEISEVGQTMTIHEWFSPPYVENTVISGFLTYLQNNSGKSQTIRKKKKKKLYFVSPAKITGLYCIELGIVVKLFKLPSKDCQATILLPWRKIHKGNQPTNQGLPNNEKLFRQNCRGLLRHALIILCRC